MQKKILVITYYWPPSGGSGVQRWLKFSKYLSRQGHSVEVITPENPVFSIRDQSLLDEIESEIVVHKVPIWEPTMLFSKKNREKVSSNKLGGESKSLVNRILSWIRGNLLIPDGRIFWIKPARTKLQDLLIKENYDAVITTGPPHSVHLIPMKLRKKFAFKWIADFRDTWSQIDFLQEFGTSKFAMAKHRKIEKKVLTNADVVTTVNEKTAELIESLFQGNVQLLYNGYDPDDFKGLKAKGNREQFTISHFGLLNRVRYPENLFIVLEELCEEIEGFKAKLRIELGGVIEDFIIKRLRESEQLSGSFIERGYLSHKDVIEAYHNSDVLLLLLNNTELGKTIMTGKVYEYLASRRPIIGIGYMDSQPSKLIQKTNTGRFFSYTEKDGLKDFLRALYTGEYKFQPKIEDVEKYSRENNVKKIIDLIDAS